jgi:chromate reductase, NAD(P)H dehydrogenase (quinone)
MGDWSGERVRVLGIAGSWRTGSYNRRLLTAAAEEAPEGVSVTVYDGLPGLPFYDEELERATGGGPQPVQELRRLVGEADALLIATPEYNGSYPGALKNGIDWLSRRPARVLAGKPVAVMGATPSQGGTRLAQVALRQLLHGVEALVLPAPQLFVREVAPAFAVDGPDEATRRQLSAMMAAFAEWIERVSPRVAR